MLFFFSLTIFIFPLDDISLHAVACRFSVFTEKCTFGVVGPVKHEINQCHIFHALLPAHPRAWIKFHTEQSEQLICSTVTQRMALMATRWTALSPGSTSTLPPLFWWQNLADSWTWPRVAVDSPRTNRICPWVHVCLHRGLQLTKQCLCKPAEQKTWYTSPRLGNQGWERWPRPRGEPPSFSTRTAVCRPHGNSLLYLQIRDFYG